MADAKRVECIVLLEVVTQLDDANRVQIGWPIARDVSLFACLFEQCTQKKRLFVCVYTTQTTHHCKNVCLFACPYL